MQLKIYLAGGYRAQWKHEVRDACLGHTYLDPEFGKLKTPEEYTPFDLLLISQADLVFGVMTEDNPGGYALCLELGYAKGLGKQTLLTDDLTSQPRARYWDMIRKAVDLWYPSLPEAIQYLAEIAKV